MNGARVILRVGGRSLGDFTRGELVELHSRIAIVLDVDKELAFAWLSLEEKERACMNAIVDAIARYFEQGFALGGNSDARQRRIACGLIREFAPSVSVAAVAAVLRVSASRVEANIHWLKEWEKNEGVRSELDALRRCIRKALAVTPGSVVSEAPKRP